jgi:AAA domain (Cdc48 subfamily)/C-terminal, D2-small domain, of ClpB protein
MIKELSNSTEYNKKFTQSWEIDGYEILTDDGYVDIKYLHETIEYEVYELKTSSGLSLKCADNHIVFLDNMSQCFVKNLEEGDRIITEFGFDIVISVTDLGYKENMYDFQLSDNSNKRYYTNGILSHNTQLAKILAKYMFDSEDSLVRIDMSEYMEKFAVSRLIGAPPGYVGHDEGGQLTEKIRRKPYSVVLLDEIEKAHPDIFNILLQVLDDGQLTDSLGRKVSFKNTIIIMTSNTGSRQLKEFGTGVGFTTKSKEETKTEDSKAVIEKQLKKTFAPEFLNRIDDVITFNSLDKSDINSIIDIEIEKLLERVKQLEFTLTLTDNAKDYITDKGFDPEYGARPLKRAIQKYIEDPITEEIISSNPEKGSSLTLDYNKEEDKMVVTYKKKKAAKK